MPPLGAMRYAECCFVSEKDCCIAMAALWAEKTNEAHGARREASERVGKLSNNQAVSRAAHRNKTLVERASNTEEGAKVAARGMLREGGDGGSSSTHKKGVSRELGGFGLFDSSERRGNCFITGSGKLQHKGRRNCVDDVAESVYPADL